MSKSNNDVLAAIISGIAPIVGAVLIICLPLGVYFAEQGWYKANKEALAEKEKYISLIESTNQKQVKLDESIRVYSLNNEKALAEKADFERLQVQLVQNFKAQKAALDKEHGDKDKALRDKQQDIDRKNKAADNLLIEAQKVMASAKTLEEEAQKQFNKNHGDGEAIVKITEDLKEKTDALSKNCDNYDKTVDPFFLDVIEKRIAENHKKLTESIKAAKQFNAAFNNKEIIKTIDLAEVQLNRANKKLRVNARN